MNLRAFRPRDLDEMDLQPQQRSFRDWAPANYASELARHGSAYTIVQDERIVACTGVVAMSRHDGLLWSFLSAHARANMVALHRLAQRFIECSGTRQVYATCEFDFEPGARWLKLLGFVRVRVLPQYGADGIDHILYCRSIQ